MWRGEKGEGKQETVVHKEGNRGRKNRSKVGDTK